MKATAFFLTVARSFFDAFVLMKLWGWFIVPLGVMPLGYWQAYGVDIMIGLVALATMTNATLADMTRAAENDESSTLSTTLAKTISYALALGTGYIAHVFMVAH